MFVGSEPAPVIASRAIDQSLLPVFQQRWWLDNACGNGRYQEAQVFKNGALVGSLPYMTRRTRLGMRWGAAPDWSHLCGPLLSAHLPDAEKPEILRKLIGQLPNNTSFGFVCGPQSPDAGLIRDAFLAANFKHSTEKTYSQSAQNSGVLARFKKKHRLRLSWATKALEITEPDEDEFVRFYADNLRDASVRSRSSLRVARDLIAAGLTQQPPQIRVTAAYAVNQTVPDAAIACAWDHTRYYYWMSTRRRFSAASGLAKPHPDAIKVLLIDAMAHAHRLSLRFDADGIATPGAEALYRDILKIPDVELRDIFLRMTWPMRCYAALRSNIAQRRVGRAARAAQSCPSSALTED